MTNEAVPLMRAVSLGLRCHAPAATEGAIEIDFMNPHVHSGTRSRCVGRCHRGAIVFTTPRRLTERAT
jgi:hypothetical protein